MEAYVASGSRPGVFYRVSLAVVQGRVHLACTCEAGRRQPGVAMPCKHAREVLNQAGADLGPAVTRAPAAPGHNRHGRPVYPPNVSGLVD